MASEIIARAFEDAKSSLPDLSNDDLIKQFLELDGEIGFINLLEGLNTADSEISTKKNIILIFSEDGSLEMKAYRNATEALRELFELEKALPGKDIVLVRADTRDEIRVAFKNYFSDAREFLELIESGCEKLSGRIADRPRKKRTETGSQSRAGRGREQS